MRRCLLTVVALVVAALLAPQVGAAALPKPNDPLLPAQWGLTQIRANEAWLSTRGGGVVIAVVDSGVDRRHPDLGPNVLPGITFDSDHKCSTGCGSGGPATPPQGEEIDGHGTHVAGIAAAIANNGTGVAGVAPGARILPVRVETPDDVASGIRWAADHGAHVINLSLGIGAGAGGVLVPGSGLVIAGLEDAIAHAHRKGVVVVAAAGISAFPLCEYPSDIDGVLCVAATARNGDPAEYSNLPGKSDLLSVRAPGGSVTSVFACGEGIVSTVPAPSKPDPEPHPCGYPTSRQYEEMVGTSMAAPHVAGVAALVRAMGCNRATTLKVLTETARNPLGEGYDDVYGWGIVDAAAAVKRAATVC